MLKFTSLAESTGVYTISLNVVIYFLDLPWVLFPANQFITLAFKKCKKDCNMLKIILVQGFCPPKVEIA